MSGDQMVTATAPGQEEADPLHSQGIPPATDPNSTPEQPQEDAPQTQAQQTPELPTSHSVRPPPSFPRPAAAPYSSAWHWCVFAFVGQQDANTCADTVMEQISSYYHYCLLSRSRLMTGSCAGFTREGHHLSVRYSSR